MIRFMTLRPTKHEEVAFLRIPNVLELRELFITEQFMSSDMDRFLHNVKKHTEMVEKAYGEDN